MTSATSARVLTLLSLLQMRRAWSGHELAERLGVTPRTVRRDVDRLRELDYRVEAWKGPAGGYRLAAGTELPPLRFDDEQAVAVAVALRSAPMLGVEIDEGAARALETVRQVMPSRLRHRVDGIEFEGSELPRANPEGRGEEGAARPARRDRVDPAVLELVSGAVRDRRVLRFEYASEPELLSLDQPTEQLSGGGESGHPHPSALRRVEPHALLARAGRWYLLSWGLDRGEWRIHRLDRMRPRATLGAVFKRRAIPTGDAAAFLSARFKGADEVDEWPCLGEVLLRVPARDAATWLPDATVTPVDEGSCRVRLGSWSWTGVLASVARFDADFEVAGPPELAACAARLSARFAAAASGSATASPACTSASATSTSTSTEPA